MFDRLRDWLILPKRTRVLIATAIGSGAFFIAISLPFSAGIYIVPFLLLVVYLSVWIAIWEGIEGREWYMLFISPLVWTIIWYLFFFLSPVRWIARIYSLWIYTLVLYGLVSVSNILNIVRMQNIQLYRVALVCNHLYNIFGLYVCLRVMYALEYSWFVNVILFWLYMTFVFTQYYWSIDIAQGDDEKTIRYQSPGVLTALVGTLILAFFNFIPVSTVSVRAMFVTASVYVISNVLSIHLQGDVYQLKLREFIWGVCLLAFGLALATR
jgi:hypothetical protein